jgi:hypothetical protein
MVMPISRETSSSEHIWVRQCSKSRATMYHRLKELAAEDASMFERSEN